MGAMKKRKRTVRKSKSTKRVEKAAYAGAGSILFGAMMGALAAMVFLDNPEGFTKAASDGVEELKKWYPNAVPKVGKSPIWYERGVPAFWCANVAHPAHVAHAFEDAIVAFDDGKLTLNSACGEVSVLAKSITTETPNSKDHCPHCVTRLEMAGYKNIDTAPMCSTRSSSRSSRKTSKTSKTKKTTA
jgi:hypothetical protein